MIEFSDLDGRNRQVRVFLLPFFNVMFINCIVFQFTMTYFIFVGPLSKCFTWIHGM